jgi:hypothetical protein
VSGPRGPALMKRFLPRSPRLALSMPAGGGLGSRCQAAVSGRRKGRRGRPLVLGDLQGQYRFRRILLEPFLALG